MTATYNFGTYKKGDTLKARTFTVNKTVGETTTSYNLTGAAIKMDIRKNSKSNAAAVKSLSIGAGITIVSAALGKFSVSAFDLDFPVGIYYYDIEVTISEVTMTWIEGTIEIEQDVTHD